MFNFAVIVAVVIGFVMLVITIIMPAVEPMLHALPL
jgi:F0F1-type ATP synthase membrane subunit b/b'